MDVYKGSVRVLDKVIIESNDTSTTARVISINGITDYNQLTDVILNIKASTVGTNEATTININGLGAKSLKMIDNGSKVDPNLIYAYVGQIYSIIYDGTDFVLIKPNDTSTTQNTTIFYIPDTILNITSTSTSDEITTAFESADNIQVFISAVENNILLYIVSTTDNKISIVESYSTESKTISIDSTDTACILYTLKFEKDNKDYIVQLIRKQDTTNAFYGPSEYNKVTVNSNLSTTTSISSTSTDNEIPTAKAVYNLFNSITNGNEVSY